MLGLAEEAHEKSSKKRMVVYHHSHVDRWSPPMKLEDVRVIDYIMEEDLEDIFVLLAFTFKSDDDEVTHLIPQWYDSPLSVK